MRQIDEHVITILADNKKGVLTRIITGIRREGCNIKSIAAARTTDENFSRITMNIECYDYLLDDVIRRVKSLNCVKELMKFEDSHFVEREYAIFSVTNECEISKKIIKKYGAQCIKDCIFELSGDRQTITNCIEELDKSASVDIARTGSIILQVPQGD